MGNEYDNDMEDTSGTEKSGVRSARLGLHDLVLVFLPAGLGLAAAVLGMVNRLPHEIHSSHSFS